MDPRTRRTLRFVLLLLAAIASSARAQLSPLPGADTGSVGQYSVTSLKTLEAQVEDLVQRAMPCTVCVRAADGRGSGSGVVVSKDGLVLTAAHVMLAAGSDLIVVFPDGRELPAKPLGANRNRDAGMAQILGEGPHPFIELGQSESLKTNQWCVALGHAGGFDPRRTPPIRLGRVLSNDRFVTTDSALIGGDSGGPLFDLEGRLIGIHSNIGESLSMNNHVPVDVYRKDWDRLSRGETWGRLPGTGDDPRRPVLGIQFSTNPADGTRIIGVSPGSPAEKAGVLVGDIIQAIDGRAVASPPEVITRVGRRRAGDTVNLKLLREDRVLELSARLVRLGSLPEDPDEVEEEVGEAGPGGTDAADGEESADAADGETAGDGALDFDELMRRARENGGQLRLTPDQFRQLRRQLQDGSAAPAGDPLFTDEIREWGERVFASYAPVVASSRRSVFPVVVRDRQVALATAVSADQLITKASEIERADFQVRLADEQYVPGEVVKTFGEYDLALIRVSGQRLTPIQWSEAGPLRLGQFVAVAGEEEQPEAIGVVSVMPRSLDAATQGFLGVVPEADRDGVRLVEIQPGTPAAAAGLQVGDLVLSLDKQKHTSPALFARAISQHGPGERIVLRVRRGDDERDVSVELGDRASLAPMPGQMDMMNELGGPLSQRRESFKEVLQHDSPLDPEDCGAPLVDLDGRVIGINVARAGRIKSYAVPASTVRQLLRLD